MPETVSASQLNDTALIRANLRDGSAGGEPGLRWANRSYILAFCFAPAAFLVFAILLLSGDVALMAGHMALAVSTYCSLRLLSKRPLFNAVQGMVFLFHWWFSVGAAGEVLSAWLGATPQDVQELVTKGAAVPWIVACGLILYAMSAELTLTALERRRWHLPTLMPQGVVYKPRTILAYVATGMLFALFVRALGFMGVQAFRSVNYLGGTESVIWWASILASLTGLVRFGVVGALAYLCVRDAKPPRWLKVGVIAYIGVNMMLSLGSGSGKGAVLAWLQLLLMALMTWRQKIPWGILIPTFILFMVIVEPLVAYGRTQAELLGLTTPQQRVQLFGALLRSPQAPQLFHKSLGAKAFNFTSVFRGIYLCAIDVADMSDWSSGPWGGVTVRDNLLALVPRVLFGTKPKMNQGNFFSRALGRSANNNIALSVPFEFVGNYGYIVGVACFAVLGVFWAAFHATITSVPRLATHPLMPLCAGWMMRIESPLGSFLSIFRDLVIVLLCCHVVWLVLRKKL